MMNLLFKAAEYASQYITNQDQRGVFPDTKALARLSELEFALPPEPTDPEEVLSLLYKIGSPATVVSTGGRYFGFVTGGTLPASLAANWLAGAWDQPADMVIASPIGAKIEEVASLWLLEALQLPRESGVGFVTGATMANFCGLAAARHSLLRKTGWDVEAQGLFGAPEISVVVGEEVHASILKALSMLGLGRERVIKTPVDGQGRMIADALPRIDGPTILIIQAGNVNSGSFDPAGAIYAATHTPEVWIHVDGAFGLWAAASPAYSHLTAGFEKADSWAVDGHKWLNVPYDSGMVICRTESDLRAALSYSAAYLDFGEKREPGFYTPEMSRRARGIEVWAALLSLGRAGLGALIERSCRFARNFSDGLSSAGYEILNEVVLNQVMVSFGDDEATRQVIAALQKDGTCWCGGTVWQGRTAMRISVSSWLTTEQDVDISLGAILRVAKSFR